jgi:hypothetical protein
MVPSYNTTSAAASTSAAATAADALPSLPPAVTFTQRFKVNRFVLYFITSLGPLLVGMRKM